jgi:hypothetical protein
MHIVVNIYFGLQSVTASLKLLCSAYSWYPSWLSPGQLLKILQRNIICSFDKIIGIFIVLFLSSNEDSAIEMYANVWIHPMRSSFLMVHKPAHNNNAFLV